MSRSPSIPCRQLFAERENSPATTASYHPTPSPKRRTHSIAALLVRIDALERRVAELEEVRAAAAKE